MLQKGNCNLRNDYRTSINLALQSRAVSCFKNTHNWLMSMQATSALILEAREN